ncbi:MAG TPA: nicotinate-nucleotide--dimethylbenzimidazole phosphoribosyltransferase [Bacteroidia bacterium]|jgi:nicotinate-nucleotide--dimethylbenzimidazole phosphoribosyltransferase|nr:nicotinate-nucleotide--dimethylbenzimidazole phosphoribosyltransferase [Bacteroidia bacterium]
MAQRLFDEEDVKILEEIILHRRDVRGNRFLQTPLPEDVIEKIILSALHGPSVGFSQPWEFVLIRDQEQKQKIRNTFDAENERASLLFDEEKSEQYARMKLEGILEAPLNMAVFYKPSRTAVLGQTSMKEVGLYSVVCAIQNMWLMARALNVGIGWVSILDPEKVRDILNAPTENQLVAYLCLGYVKEFLDKPELEILAWEKRKFLPQVLFQEKYKAPETKTFSVAPLNDKLTDALRHKIDFKTKPRGALGILEEIALQIGRIQNTLTPVLNKPVILVFAADHGIANEGVSAYPQEVTYQMVLNFLNGGAAINVFCKQNGIDINIVDAGVNYDFPGGLAGLTRCKIGRGTKSFLREPAMSAEETQKAIQAGAKIVRDLHQQGSNIIGFGEMGIGNTASASALMSVICKKTVEECVGKGTGVDQAGLEKKKTVISQAIALHGGSHTPLDALRIFGGFEIAQMCGAMLQAAELGMVILVDGFISTAAFLVASEMEPAIKGYAIFCHQSGEQGHRVMLEYLKASSLLNLGMRLGEGTGSAVAYPVVKAAVSFLNEMASFESAGVTDKE